MDEWQKKFDKLRKQFLTRSQDRLGAIRELLNLIKQEPQNLDLLREIRQLFHWCAGSGGIYGFESVTKLGLLGEEICDQFIHAEKTISEDAASKLLSLADQIYACIESGEQTEAPAPPLESRVLQETKEHILFVQGEQQLSADFVQDLQKLGFHIETIDSCHAARDLIMKRLPELLLVNLPLADGVGYELATLIRNAPGGERPPIIFMSQQAGFLDKVEAIKSGADAFFEHPLDKDEILSKIKHLMERDRPEKYKILSVEDDPDQAEYIKLTLESAGYTVVSLQDPNKFEDVFLQCDPDLVLLDVMLGTMTGFDLAQYIRQKDRYAALPVVFLTTENGLEMHIKSSRIGGDDHLIKPIAPQLLAAAVSGRLERARSLKRLIDRDGLSGCLNYGPFMDRATEFAKSDSHRFSMAMLLFDIDSMSVINERSGFAVGDKVIATLGRLISKSLRNASLTGRISGDRFAVIMENLDDQQVHKIAEQVVKDFSLIQQFAPDGAFCSTLSASFASYNGNLDLKGWMSAAEKLLAEAKAKGGNQIKSTAGSADWTSMRI